MHRREQHLATAAGALMILAGAATARAQVGGDFVYPIQGAPVRGTIVEMNWREVKIQTRGGETRTLAPPEITRITFEGEPEDLRLGRETLRAGRLDDALAQLSKVRPSQLSRDPIRQNWEFLVAKAHAGLALQGDGDLRDAGRRLAQFHRDHPNSAYRMEASRLLGDMAVALGSFDGAAQYYGQLTGAPWPEVKLQGMVLMADALRAAGKHDEALVAYQQAASEPVDSDPAQRNHQLARVGQAACLAAQGDPERGVQMVEQVIAQSDSQDAEVMAAAYNVLGGCHRRLQQPVDAVLAFLHVHLLFSQESLAHAEALYHLVELWPEVGNPERAESARQLLVSRYPNTPWAQRLP